MRGSPCPDSSTTPSPPSPRAAPMRRGAAGTAGHRRPDLVRRALRAPYDLLAAALNTQPARLRGITARWRRAGYAATGRLGPGPAWCWLTPGGMTATGFAYPATRPSLARLAHIRAVLAARLWLSASPAWAEGGPGGTPNAASAPPAPVPFRPPGTARRRDLVAQHRHQPVRRTDLGHRGRAECATRRTLPRLTPRLKARLFQVFDITVLWNKPARQATVTAEITEATMQALDAILDPGQDGYHDTDDDQPEPMGHLANTPRLGRTAQPLNS